MGMGTSLPSNVYISSFTPDTEIRAITIDTGLTLGPNHSFAVGIVTNDLQYGTPNLTASAGVAIIDYIGQGSTDYSSYHRYIGPKKDGTNDYYANGTINFSNGMLTISGLYGHFIPNCRYNVVVLV